MTGALRNLLFLVAACFVVGLSHFLFEGDAAWYAFFFSLMAQQAMQAVLLYTKYSYADLRAKYVAFILITLPPIEGTLFVIDELDNPEAYLIALIVLSALSVAWLLYASWRNLSINSVEPKSGKLYRVTKRPDNFTGFIMSLFGKAVAGSGVWIDGKMYGYRHNSFQELSTMTGNTIFIETSIRSTKGIEAYLKSKVGDRWTWHSNCLTIWWGLRRVQQ